MKAMGAPKTEYQKKMVTRNVAIEGLDEKMTASKLESVFNSSDTRKAEVPSANCHAAAHSLAELASVMANKGKMSKGGELLSEETWRMMHDGAKPAVDAFFGRKATH